MASANGSGPSDYEYRKIHCSASVFVGKEQKADMQKLVHHGDYSSDEKPFEFVQTPSRTFRTTLWLVMTFLLVLWIASEVSSRL